MTQTVQYAVTDPSTGELVHEVPTDTDEQVLAAVAAAQEAFTEAKKRAVGLEKLESRHREQVAAGDLSAEQAAIDEIATGAWQRATEGGDA